VPCHVGPGLVTRFRDPQPSLVVTGEPAAREEHLGLGVEVVLGSEEAAEPRRRCWTKVIDYAA
jgi:hypothetical protein